MAGVLKVVHKRKQKELRDPLFRVLLVAAVEKTSWKNWGSDELLAW